MKKKVLQALWSESGFWIAPNWPYSEKKQCVTIYRHDVIFKFFWRCFVSLVKFSYWSKFYVNIITGSRITTILFCKRLTRNPEIGNTPNEFCPIFGDWGKLEIPNLSRMSLIKCYWMLQNTRVTAFTNPKLLRENQQGGGGWGENYHPPILGLNFTTKFFSFINLPFLTSLTLHSFEFIFRILC